MSSPGDEDLLASALDLDARRDLEDASQRVFRERNAQGIPAISKMRQAWTPAEIDSAKRSGQTTLDSLYDLAEPRTFPVGDTLNLGQWLELRKALDKDPHFSKTKQPARPAGRPSVQPGDLVTGTLASSDFILSANPFSGDAIVSGVQAAPSGTVRGVDRTRVTAGDDADPEDFDGDVVGTSTLRVQKKRPPKPSLKLPSIPERPTTHADAVASLTLLTNPDFPKDPKAIQELLLKATKYDPLAQAAITGGPSTVPLALAERAKAVVNDEWGIDLTYKGHDYSLPVSNRRVPPLDPARQYLVDALTSLAVASVRNDRYQQDGVFDMTSPFGINLMNRSARTNPGAISRFLGALNSNLALRGNTVDPVDAFLKVAFPGMDDPEKHPTQSFFGESIRFFGDWALPGQNAKDVMGGRILPFGVKTAEHRTTASLREAFGAPAVGTIYLPDGSHAFVSLVDKKFRTDLAGYSRGLFGYNTEGEEISGWNAIREAAVANYLNKAAPSRLDESASPTKQKIATGTYWDIYAQEWRTLDESFVVGKDGKPRRISAVQVDHVLSLAWMYGRGFDKWINRYLASDGTDEKLNAMWDLAASFGTGGGPTDAQGRPLQLVPTFAATNQDKGSKGPGEWLPFPSARNDREHRANEEYVSRVLRLVAYGKSEQQRITGEVDRGFFSLSRTDRITIERVRRGFDQVPDNIYGRAKASVTDAYLEHLVEPDMLAQSLHRQVNEFLVYSVAGLSLKTALWKYVPANQLYLFGREHFVSGVWSPFWAWSDERRAFTGEPGAKAPRTLRKHLSVFWDNRYGDVMRRRVPAQEEAIKVARMIRLQGSMERIYAGIPDADGALPQVLANRHRVVAPSWAQGVSYGFGKANPFDAPENLKPELWQLSKRPEFVEDVNRLMRDFAEKPGREVFQTVEARRRVSFLKSMDRNALTDLVNEIRRTLDAGGETAEEISDFQRRVRAAAKADALSRYETSIMAIRGRAPLAPSPFLKDVYSIWVGKNSWLRKTELTGRAVVGEGSVKTVDYGLKALSRGDDFLSGGILRNAPNLPGILGVEAVASMMAGQIGATQHVPAHFGRWRWSESRIKPLGFLDWVEAQQRTMERTIAFQDTRIRRLQAVMAPIQRQGIDLAVQLRTAPEGLPSLLLRDQFSRIEARGSTLYDRLTLAELNRKYTAENLAKFRDYMPQRILDDARAPKSIQRLLKDLAYSNPRLPLTVGRVLHAPIGAAQAALAPVKAVMATSKFLNGRHVGFAARGTSATLKVGGAALQGFGFLEAGMRFSLASRQSSLGWEFMDDEQRANVDAYVHPGRFDRALDVGLVFTPLQAYTGAALALTNEVGIRAVRSKMMADTGYVSDYHSRLLQSRPLVSDEYRRVQAKADARRRGLLLYTGDEAERDRAFRADSAYAELQISQKRATFKSLGDEKRLRKLEELELKLRGQGSRPGESSADAFRKGKAFPAAPSEITQQSVLIRNRVIATEEEKRGRAQNRVMEEYFGLFAPSDSMESSKRRRLMGLEAARIVERDRFNASKQAAHELRTKFSWKALSQLLDAANPEPTRAVGFIPYDSAVIKQDRMRADSLSKIPARPRRPK